MFDSVLQSNGIAPSRFGAGAVSSLIVHGAIIAGAVYMSLHHASKSKDDGPEVTFFQAPPPPPPPPPPAGGSSVQVVKHEVKPIVKPDTFVDVKDKKPVDETPKPSDSPKSDSPKGEVGGVVGGVEGGVAGGVVGGVVGGTLGGVVGGELGGTGTQVVAFGEGMTRPKQTSGVDFKTDFVYPREAAEAHVGGLAIVRCRIELDGHLEGCRIIKGLAHMDSAILAALATQRYTPVMFEGHAVLVDYTFNLRFVAP